MRPFGMVFVFALLGFGDRGVRAPSMLRTCPGRFPPLLGFSWPTLPAPRPQQRRCDKGATLRAACSAESRQSRESVAEILNDGRLPEPGARVVVRIVPLGLHLRECPRKFAYGRREAEQYRWIRAGFVSSGMLKRAIDLSPRSLPPRFGRGAHHQVGATPSQAMEEGVIHRAYGPLQVGLPRPAAAPLQKIGGGIQQVTRRQVWFSPNRTWPRMKKPGRPPLRLAAASGSRGHASVW